MNNNYIKLQYVLYR